MPEVYFPGSDKPFRPLNPHGRSMPRVPQRERPPLFQLVATRNGKETPLGPKMERQFVDQLYDTVVGMLKCGAETELKNPHIVRCVSSEDLQRRETVRSLLRME